MNFKVKRHWWMWALWALYHIIASGFLRIGIYHLLLVIILLDFIIIFPEASHFRYDIINRQFTVKRIGYYDISFPCDKIMSVENATLFTMWGGRSAVINMNQIIDSSFGAFKITYIDKNGVIRRKGLVISPKNGKAFLSELILNVDPKVIWINNTESAFKKKKDEY